MLSILAYSKSTTATPCSQAIAADVLLISFSAYTLPMSVGSLGGNGSPRVPNRRVEPIWIVATGRHWPSAVRSQIPALDQSVRATRHLTDAELEGQPCVLSSSDDWVVYSWALATRSLVHHPVTAYLAGGEVACSRNGSPSCDPAVKSHTRIVRSRPAETAIGRSSTWDVRTSQM